MEFTRRRSPRGPAPVILGTWPPVAALLDIVLLRAGERMDAQAADVSLYRRWRTAAPGAIYAVLVVVPMVADEPAQLIDSRF